MIVEINFLEKPKRKNLAPFLLTVIGVIITIGFAAVFLFQTNQLKSELDTESKHLDELKSLVSTNQEISSGMEEAIDLKNTLASLRQDAMPSVALYEKVTGQISAGQLLAYEQTENNQLVLTVSFPNLDRVAAYIAVLKELDYVEDIALTNISKTESEYEAIVTLLVDEGSIEKEFNHHE